MTIRDCMVDLETLDTNPDAVILSIGAVLFDPYAPEFTVTSSFYVPIHIDGQDRSISEKTLAWWMIQTLEARKVFEECDEQQYLHDALAAFEDFLAQAPFGKIWSKPSWFDLAILAHAYGQLGEELPWEHRQAKCFRTLVDESPLILPPMDGVKHNALDDALHQARCLHMIRQDQAMKRLAAGG